MVIKYKNYEIVVGNYSYDLYQTRPPKQVHKNKNSNKNVRVGLGCYSKLENCIERIILIDMSTSEGIISLRDFLKLYKTFKEDIKNAFDP
ncbi:unnamed protein product [marine sediment metagenome]|uniref:Uncharacterized protein n=1 Tax=marine sediment metagenome TaxID=412755 RepID=X0VIH7_9ZZZZ